MSDLRLYTVTDSELDPDEVAGWWEAVWASSESEALEWARENYGGECPKGEDPGIKVISVMEADETDEPEEEGVHRERRLVVLRDAKWREEGEHACQCCELYALGLDEYRVCCECCLCPECREDTREEPCEACSGRE